MLEVACGGVLPVEECAWCQWMIPRCSHHDLQHWRFLELEASGVTWTVCEGIEIELLPLVTYACEGLAPVKDSSTQGQDVHTLGCCECGGGAGCAGSVIKTRRSIEPGWTEEKNGMNGIGA
jgi:hypothetical protein